MSERTRRLDHLLTEEISRILTREVQDPDIGFVTITGVQVARDLRHATVWASVIGDDRERRTTLRALERAMPFVRHHLGGLRLRHIPDLHVREDDTSQRGTRIMGLLERIESAGPGGIADPDALTADLAPPTLPIPGPRAEEPQAAAVPRPRRASRPRTSRSGLASPPKGGSRPRKASHGR